MAMRIELAGTFFHLRLGQLDWLGVQCRRLIRMLKRSCTMSSNEGSPCQSGESSIGV